MPSIEIEQTIRQVALADSWEERVQAIRRIPERHGRQDQPRVYAVVAAELYRPHLSSEFAFVPRREDYEPETVSRAYRLAFDGTEEFSRVEVDDLASVLKAHPETLLVFRTIIGYTPKELSVATREVGSAQGWRGVGDGRIKAIERGGKASPQVAGVLAETIHHVRTGSSDQGEIATRFTLTVRPAPDFVIFEPPRTPRALLECKLTNDGGTARDKASRFGVLREESVRLGGIPVFAVLDGLGWERVNDALGPVVRDCDGRVFTLETLPEMVQVEPFPSLISRA